MDRGKGRRALVVATDPEGRVVAAAYATGDEEMQNGLIPLEGQTVHELEVPEELSRLSSPTMVLASMEDARVIPGRGLSFRKIREDK